MNTQEIANKLVQLCREGKNREAINELYADNIVSIEPDGAPDQRMEGKEKVLEKNRKFFDSLTEIHSTSISEPIIAGPYFSCAMDYDLTMKEHGRVNMSEIGVYEVKDGKIVADQFFYQM